MITILDKKYPNIRIEEFVSRPIFTSMRSNSIRLLDPRIFDIAQGIRDWYGTPITINNWHSSGTFQNRGFRAHNTNVGAIYSQHRFGRAIDFNLRNITPQKVYRDILDNQTHFMNLGISCMEDIRDTTTWVHVDCRITNTNNILIVRP
jgi:uncharacterized protein YcbK (DUF882 family)